jgi:hypothetical protein
MAISVVIIRDTVNDGKSKLRLSVANDHLAVFEYTSTDLIPAGKIQSYSSFQDYGPLEAMWMNYPQVFSGGLQVLQSHTLRTNNGAQTCDAR